jgi:hypothetical protein
LKKLSVDFPISNRTIRSLFNNSDRIYQGSTAFLSDLVKVASLPPEEQDVGRTFLQHSDYFRLYIPYCRNQTIAVKSLQTLLMAPEICEWIDEISLDLPEKLSGYLIKPVQRICRLQLLLREMIKYTREGDVYVRLTRAADEVSEVLNQANEEKRKVDQIEEIFDGLTSLGITFGSDSIYLDQSSCGVMGSHGSVLWDSKYFLFTDVLVIVREKDGKWSAIDVILFSDGVVVWQVDVVENAFAIVRRTKTKKTIVVMKTASEKTKAMERISDVIFLHLAGNDKKVIEKKQPTLTVNKYEIQRPIYYEEIFSEGANRKSLSHPSACEETEMMNDGVSGGVSERVSGGVRFETKISQRLARAIGVDDLSLAEDLGLGQDRRTLRMILESVVGVGEKPMKTPHDFEKHHFRTPRWCDFCKKFIYGLRYQVSLGGRGRERRGERRERREEKGERRKEKERREEKREEKNEKNEEMRI